MRVAPTGSRLYRGLAIRKPPELWLAELTGRWTMILPFPGEGRGEGGGASSQLTDFFGSLAAESSTRN